MLTPGNRAANGTYKGSIPDASDAWHFIMRYASLHEVEDADLNPFPFLLNSTAE